MSDTALLERYITADGAPAFVRVTRTEGYVRPSFHDGQLGQAPVEAWDAYVSACAELVRARRALVAVFVPRPSPNPGTVEP